MQEKQNIETKIEIVMAQLDRLERDLSKIQTQLEQRYVTTERFELELKPLKSFYFGIISLMSVTVLGALLSMVIKTQ